METSVPEAAPGDVWNHLQANADAQLVDVRTNAELAFVGFPDLGAINKSIIFAQWSSFPEQEVDPQYADKLGQALETAGFNKDVPLFFLCRSGVRSLAAARAMAAYGYARCHNVTDGFEGPPDAERRRGRIAGWKASGLPWVQG
ncbi:MAG: rhodanese-like domain-containing protein [Hyphomicrobiaceae bacterium]